MLEMTDALVVSHDSGVADAWKQLGKRLQQARGSMSIREAARAAGFSEAQWRRLEAGGYKVEGSWHSVRAKDATLEAAAKAVGLDPEELFSLLGRAYQGRPETISLAEPRSSDDVREFSERLSRVERLLLRLLERDPPAGA